MPGATTPRPNLDPPLHLAATSDPCAPKDRRSAGVGVGVDEPAVDLSGATDEALVRAARLCDDIASSVLVDRHGPALLQAGVGREPGNVAHVTRNGREGRGPAPD